MDKLKGLQAGPFQSRIPSGITRLLRGNRVSLNLVRWGGMRVKTENTFVAYAKRIFKFPYVDLKFLTYTAIG